MAGVRVCAMYFLEVGDVCGRRLRSGERGRGMGRGVGLDGDVGVWGLRSWCGRGSARGLG